LLLLITRYSLLITYYSPPPPPPPPPLEWCRDALKTINALEHELERR
jgi:hypothetical protein